MIRSLDLVGKRIGMFVVQERVGADRNNNKIWRCKCDCGNFFNRTATVIAKRTTVSCGCYRRKRASELTTALNKNRREANPARAALSAVNMQTREMIHRLSINHPLIVEDYEELERLWKLLIKTKPYA